MLYRQLLFHYHNDIELNLIKIRLINFDFGKLLKILRVFADGEVGICPDGFSLPRQHSLQHYIFSITQFGAPNGLCSSITESKHIKEVKKTYHHSSRNKPLGQMLITTQCINKITAARVDFNARGMLNGPSPAIDIFSGLPSGHANHDQLVMVRFGSVRFRDYFARTPNHSIGSVQQFPRTLN